MGKSTEGYVFAAQEWALQTSYFLATIEKGTVDQKCEVCGKEVESVGYVASGYTGLVHREYQSGGMIEWV